MRNLKKYLAVFIVVAMLLTTMLPAMAAESSFKYEDQAQKLYDLGLYKGESTTSFVPALDKKLDRQTGAVMVLRLFGLEEDAKAMTAQEVNSALSKFADVKDIADWAKNQVAYCVENGMIKGFADPSTGKTVFNPKGDLNGKAYASIVLQKLGYNGDFEFNVATSKLAEVGGLTEEEATEFATKAMVRDDLVGMSFGILKATYKDEEVTVISKLIELEKLTEEKVMEVDEGLVSKEDTNEGVASEIYSVTATNGTLTVVFKDAPSADPVAADFKVTKAVNGAAAEAVTPTVKTWTAATKTAVLEVPVVAATTAAQSVVYGVAFKEGTAVNAAALTITALNVSAIKLTPDSAQYTQVGKEQELTAIVTGANSTALAGLEVTFIIDAGTSDVGNADDSKKATTDATGKASVKFTRSNPGTDSISAYATVAPTIRATSTIFWNVSDSAITVTPAEAAVLAKTETRTYTFVAKKQNSTTDLDTSAAYKINFWENLKDDPTGLDVKDSGAKINGTDVHEQGYTGALPANKSVSVMTDAAGRCTFTVTCTKDVTVTPVVFKDADSDGLLDSNEIRAFGGAVTFQNAAYNIAFTEITTGSQIDLNSQKVYKVKVTNQSGSAVTSKKVGIKIKENYDAVTSNDTQARIAWYANTGSPLPTRIGNGYAKNVDDTVTQEGINADITTTFYPDSNGEFTFAIGNANSSKDDRLTTPTVWIEDIIENGTQDLNETYRDGPSITFISQTVGGGKVSDTTVSKTPATNLTATTGDGIYTLTYTILNKGGSNFSLSDVQTVEFLVKNLPIAGETTVNDAYVQNVSCAAGYTLSPAVAMSSSVTDCTSYGMKIAANANKTFNTYSSLVNGAQVATIRVAAGAKAKLEITAKASGLETTKAVSTITWISAAPTEPSNGTAASVGLNVYGGYLNSDTGNDITLTAIDGGTAYNNVYVNFTPNQTSNSVIVNSQTVSTTNDSVLISVYATSTATVQDIVNAINSSDAGGVVTASVTNSANSAAVIDRSSVINNTALSGGSAIGIATTEYSISGTVTEVKKGASTESAADGFGSYKILTTGGQLLTVSYDKDDTFQVAGSVVTAAGFEPKLSVGDVVTLTNNTTTGNDTHNIVTNN